MMPSLREKGGIPRVTGGTCQPLFFCVGGDSKEHVHKQLGELRQKHPLLGVCGVYDTLDLKQECELEQLLRQPKRGVMHNGEDAAPGTKVIIMALCVWYPKSEQFPKGRLKRFDRLAGVAELFHGEDRLADSLDNLLCELKQYYREAARYVRALKDGDSEMDGYD